MTKREELVEAAARAIDPIAWVSGAWMGYDVPSQAECQAAAIKKATAALDAILERLHLDIVNRALAYDRQADAEKDGTRKMQGAALAVLANELLSTLEQESKP